MWEYKSFPDQMSGWTILVFLHWVLLVIGEVGLGPVDLHDCSDWRPKSSMAHVR